MRCRVGSGARSPARTTRRRSRHSEEPGTHAFFSASTNRGALSTCPRPDSQLRAKRCQSGRSRASGCATGRTFPVAEPSEETISLPTAHGSQPQASPIRVRGYLRTSAPPECRHHSGGPESDRRNRARFLRMVEATAELVDEIFRLLGQQRAVLREKSLQLPLLSPEPREVGDDEVLRLEA